MASLISLVLVMISRNISAWVTIYAHPGNAGPTDPNEWKYWSCSVGSCLSVGGGFVCFCVVLFNSLTNLCDRVINR